LIVSSSSVTAEVSASARPSIVTDVPTEIDSWARIVPANVESLPSVAELPTWKNTLQAWRR
jgi:hypothetical protein